MKGRVVVVGMVVVALVMAYVASRNRMPRPEAMLPEPGPILLLLVDGLRPDALGCYGGPAGASPNMDRLAEGGLRFTDVTATTNDEDLGLASMLSGRRASEVERGPALPGLVDKDSLPEALRQHEYTTTLFHDSRPVSAREFEACRPLAELELGGARRRFLCVRWALPAVTERAAYQEAVHGIDAQIGAVMNALGALADGDDATVVLTATRAQQLDEDARVRFTRTLHPATLQVPLLIRLPRQAGVAREARVLERPVTLLDVPATLTELCRFPPLPTGEGLSLLAPPPKSPRKFMAQGRDLTPAPEWDEAMVRIGPLEYWFRGRARPEDEAPQEFAFSRADDPARTDNLLDADEGLREELRRYLREFMGFVVMPGPGDAADGLVLRRWQG